MHDYLRAIGFGRLADRKSLQRLLSLVMTKPDREYYAGNGDRTDYWEKSKDFLPGAGLTVRGDTDEKGIREYEYFFPHYRGSHMSFTGNVDLEKAFEREEYNGVCELSDMGVVMVFHLNRLKDYAARIREYGYLEEAPICLSGLSVQGSVLIPLARTQPGDDEKKMQSATRRHREAAENGDPEEQRIGREIFYHTGRCVYLLDAADDLEKDVQNGSYNPLLLRFPCEGGRLSDEDKAQLRATIRLSQHSAAAALALRPPDVWQPILENIVSDGLTLVTDMVLAGTWQRAGKKEERYPDILKQGEEIR